MGPAPGVAVELSQADCWARVRGEAFGRLAVVGPDGPLIYPVNAMVDHGSVVFRTAGGAKVDAMRNDPRVAFEVDGYDPDTRVAWSVLLSGSASEVHAYEDAVIVAELGVTPWQVGTKPIYIRITPTTVTGREFERPAT